MKENVTAYLHMEYGYPEYVSGMPYEQVWKPALRMYKGSDGEDRIYIREMQIEVDVPDDFDPVPSQVKALEKLKLAALEKYQKDVAEIQDRLNKLLALTNEVL